MKINASKIKRHSNHIRIAPGITATEGSNGLPTLTIRKNNKITKKYRGSSLSFCDPLTQKDKEYLLSLI